MTDDANSLSARSGPRGWLGPSGGRRARWRRRVLRRFGAIAAMAAAVTLVIGRIDAAAHRDLRPVVVASRDLGAGATVAAADLRVALVDASGAPPSAARDPIGLVGQVLAGPVAAGETVTSTRLVGADLLRGQPPDAAAVWLPTLGDPSVSGVRRGGHVDVYRPGQSAPVVRGAVVLNLSQDTPESAPRAAIVANATTAGVLVALPAARIGDVFAGQAPDSSLNKFVVVAR